MNAKQLIAAVFALTAASAALADQNLSHAGVGKTRADVIAAKGGVQQAAAGGKVLKASSHLARGQNLGA
jgi:hypothetical protein